MTFDSFVFNIPLSASGVSEDAHQVIHSEGDNGFVVVVVDGYGIYVEATLRRRRDKSLASQFAQEVCRHLVESLPPKPVALQLEQAFARTAGHLRPWSQRVDPLARPGQRSVGAVASVVSVCDEELYLAQAGDCRLYVSTCHGEGFQQVSEDHTPTNTLERLRLQRYIDSGQVRCHQPWGRPHVLMSTTQIPDKQQHLEVTRGFGNFVFGEAFLNVPEHRSWHLDALGRGQLLALCTDGGNNIVEAIMRELCGRASRMSFSELTTLFANFMTDEVDDDTTIVFFRERQ